MVIQKKPGSKRQRQWTPRDFSVLSLLGQQRALSLDHLPRFLALLEGKAGSEQAAHFKSTAHNLVEHLHHAGLIDVQHFGKSTSGWIWLTKKGMQVVGLSSSSWKRPARSTLPALHAANMIRLHITEHDPQSSWLSQQHLPNAALARELQVIPNAVLETESGERIAIHIVLRVTGTEEQIAARMLQQLERETRLLEESSYSALWYYATADAAKRLRIARARIAESVTRETARNICIFSYPLIGGQILYRGHHAPICALAWSRDGKWLASAGEDERLHIWNATTGKERFHLPLSACPSVIDWSCHGSWIALGDQDGRLSFWEGVTGKLHMAAIDSTERITGLAWSPLNDDVISSCSADKLRVYDLRHNVLQWESQRFGRIETLAWSPDGARLALGGSESCVRLIDATTGKHLQTYRKHNAAVRALTWSPDSQWIASASHEPNISIWDATSGKKRRSIWSGLSAINVLSWSPDGTRIACAGSDPSVQVWDVTTGRLLQTYADHSDEITDLAWSPTSTMLASTSSDGTIHVYPVVGGPQ